jgi:hypothetical protein
VSEKRSQRGPEKEDVLVYSLDFDFIPYLPAHSYSAAHTFIHKTQQPAFEMPKGNKCG